MSIRSSRSSKDRSSRECRQTRTCIATYFSFLIGADNVAVSGVYSVPFAPVIGIDMSDGIRSSTIGLSSEGFNRFVPSNKFRKRSVCETYRSRSATRNNEHRLDVQLDVDRSTDDIRRLDDQQTSK
jgi:hypothetical protein